jgi:hypothetical protein
MTEVTVPPPAPRLQGRGPAHRHPPRATGLSGKNVEYIHAYLVNQSGQAYRQQETLKVANPPARLKTHSNPCDHYGGEGETREIVLRIAVISGCDASPVLELAEHSFDEISAFAGPAVQRIGRPA